MRALLFASLLLATTCAVLVLGCNKDQSTSPVAATPPKPTITELEIKDVKVGTGPVAANKDLVHVAYTGKLPDGTVFDTTENDANARPPLSFRVGDFEVIEGWERGVLGMRVGGVRELRIPPKMAYADKGVEGLIPPNTELFFTITLLDVVKPGDEETYEILTDKPGTGPEVKKGDKVDIHFTATYVDERTFDTNEDLQPLSLTVGEREVIVGLDEGLVGMRLNGERKLRVPSRLAYGPRGRASVPPNSTLFLYVRVVKHEPAG